MFLMTRLLTHAAFIGCALLAPASAALAQSSLPPEVDAALARAKLPKDALSVLVVEAQGNAAPRASHRAQALVNPA